MDQWQVNHISAHLHMLLSSTTCNKQLVHILESNGALEKPEKEKLNSKKDRMERAKLLYVTLEKKSNGFPLLLYALVTCKQTEPYNILLNGFVQTVIPNVKVNILGNVQKLVELFSENELEKIVQNYRAHVTTVKLEEYVMLCNNLNAGNEPITLINDCIPHEIPFYIPRFLRQGIKANSQLFRVDSCDVNIIKGMDSIQLPSLMAPRRPSNSSISTSLNEAPFCRHFVVGSKQDFEEICKVTKVPIHLLPFDDQVDKNYIVESSSRSSRTSFEYFHRKGNAGNKRRKSVAISEEKFMEEVLEQQQDSLSICFFDLPGTGKSLLLGNLAMKIKQHYPERLVAFIKLSQFVEYVVKQDKKLAFAVNNSSFLKKCLFQYLSTSHLSFCILTELIIKENVYFELFLDAFDEVQDQHVKIAKTILIVLSNELPQTRLYVTCRPHVQHEVEASLQHISYSIEPLTPTSQINFLTRFWSHLHPKCDQDRISEFAHFCVEQLNENLSEEERRIAGIPLQCRLVAETFATSVKYFANSQNNNVPLEKLCNLNNSLYELYKSFMNLRFHTSNSRASVQDMEMGNLSHIAPIAKRMMEAVIGKYTYFSELQEIKNYHMLLALNILFPEIPKLFSHMLAVELSNITTEYSSNIFSIGMLERKIIGGHEIVEFVHRTFAEYLAAEILSDALDQLHQSPWTEALRKQLLKFLFKTVLKTEKVTDEHGASDYHVFVYSVSVYFLNFACVGKNASCSNELVVTTFACLFTGDQLYALLHAILCDNHLNIFILIKHLLSRMGQFQLWKYKAKLFPSKNRARITQLLNTAARYSSVALVKQLFLLFQQHFDIDLDAICKDMSGDDDTPLNAAVRRLDYEMVQFFAEKKFSLENGPFLENCVESSVFDSPEIIEKRIKICKLILSKNTNIIQEWKNSSALHQALEFGAHLDIVKFLIREGANIRAKVEEETVVERAARYMCAQDFHEFCRFLIQDCTAKQLFISNCESPLPYILKDNKIQNQTIEMIIKREDDDEDVFDGQSESYPQLNLNCTDAGGRPLLMCAVLGKRSISILKALIEMGAQIIAPDWNENTFAHFISQYYSAEEYHEIVKLLVEKGMRKSFQVANKKGETPLHRGVFQLELLPETLNLLVGPTFSENIGDRARDSSSWIDLNAVDQNGGSVLHWALKGKRSLDFVKHLVKLGATWSGKDGHNNNLAHSCVENGMVDHLKYFVELGCDINEDNVEGYNALEAALKNVYEDASEIVEFLLAKEVQKGSVNMRMNMRRTRRCRD